MNFAVAFRKLILGAVAGSSLLTFGGAIAHAQQVSGVPGSPSATTTIDGNIFRRRRRSSAA